MNPLVSILIPVYNTEKYVAEAIESALNQTYKNIEIIIVDDGSRDKSWEIIESYREKYPAIIKTYKQVNKGACAARNKAFKLSSGQYIQYLDADDLLSNNKIEEQLKLFEKYGNEIIASCTWIRFKEHPNEANIKKRYIDKDYQNPIDWLIDSWQGKGVGANNIWLTGRDIITKAGNWNEKLKKNQDGEFFSRVLLNTKLICFSDKAFVYYRDTENSITNMFTYETALNTLFSCELYLTNLKDFLERKDIKLALAANFSSFYSYVYPHFPDLLKRSEENISKLGLDYFPFVGGSRFKILSGILGFKNAVALRYRLKKIVK